MSKSSLIKQNISSKIQIINKDNISYQYIGYLHDGGYIEISENDCVQRGQNKVNKDEIDKFERLHQEDDEDNNNISI